MDALLRHTPALIVLACLAALGTALLAQYVGGLPPCALCIWQRWAYGAAAAAGLAAMAARGRLRAALAALAGLAQLAGAGIAAFHVGVEQKWWEGLSTCTGSVGAGLSLEELRAAIEAAPMVRCDEVPWSLFGLSIAGYNVLASLALAAFALAGGRRIAKESRA